MNSTRRHFLKTSAAMIAAGTMPSYAEIKKMTPARFQISLAQWSLHRMLIKGDLSNLDFPKFTKDTFDIHAVEYVNSFFRKYAKNKAYLKDLKSRTDGEGQIGAATKDKRNKTVENHKKWVEAAKFLGCHSIRVNASGTGTRKELAKQVTEGLHALSTFAKGFDVNIIVENHGGLSSDGAWLAGVLKAVNRSNCGSLPDFGNFHKYDRYQGIADLMPYAKGVSAKSRIFDAQGEEKETNFLKAMKVVAASPYKGYVGIEYEGAKLPEQDGVLATKKLLERTFTKI